jgi:hypothetical protein
VRITRRKTKAKPSVKDLGSGIEDLPIEVALVVEEHLARAQAAEPAPTPPPSTVAELVERLTAIRERIWRLRAVFAVTLSQETAIEANKFLMLFQDLAAELKAKDPEALERLVCGHHSLLMAPALPIKPTVSLATQRLVEMRWEAAQRPTRSAPSTRPDTIHDGMSAFL